MNENAAPAAETAAETKARWARIDAMYADHQFLEKGCQSPAQVAVWAKFRANRAAVMAGPFA